METIIKKRANVLAIHSLCEFVFSVPSLSEAFEFYSAFGLRVIKNEANYLEIYTHANTQCWARIFEEGDIKKLKWITFGIYTDDYVLFKEHLKQFDILFEIPQEAGDLDSIWLKSPDGLHIQIIATDQKVSPNQKSIPNYPLQYSLSGRAPSRINIEKVQPTYLSHIALFTADLTKSIHFFTEVLGLRMSDQSEGVVAFLHGAHGSEHHLIALSQSDSVGLHHMSWNVNSFDEIGLGKQQMENEGYNQGWGIGRHVLGSNYFYYVRDPWGSYCEYSHDMDFISPLQTWPEMNHSPEDSLYAWGPYPPQEFTRNFEV